MCENKHKQTAWGGVFSSFGERRKGMKKTDVLVIGGSAAGLVAALTGKSQYPEKDFLVVRKEEVVVVPCGIPYVFGSLESSAQNVIPDASLEKAGIDLVVGEVTDIDVENKICKLANGQKVSYDKLVLAIGSKPVKPAWLKGKDLKGVFTVPKDKEYLDALVEKLQGKEKIIVIGGGFIGVEISDELNKQGKDVTVVEILPHVLGAVFDEELATKAEEVLLERGVRVEAGVGVKEICGNGQVETVKLQDGKELPADSVILSMGYQPNVELAIKAGIETNELGFIKVDRYLRTRIHDVFAVGDCAEKRDFITNKPIGAMLASTACAEARVTGMNLFKLETVRTFSGTISNFATAFGEHSFGVAGITEGTARKEGFDIVTSTFEGVDHHPGKLPGTHKQAVKLVVAKDSGLILGGSVFGGHSTGEIVNVIGLAIQNNMTVSSLLTMQIGTHPLLTAPPTAYPLIKAAEVALRKIHCPA
jgi:NADPH-dependent 2,4-dienoyl-CoA reductase/sulfur reductase-like enzyme